MVSGALLLKKEESFSYILKHRVVRILIVMILCTFFIMIKDKSWNFLLIFSQKLNWYLYQYLAYLLMLPFLRKISLHSNKKEMCIYLFLVYIFYSLSGILTYFNFPVNFVSNLTFYNSTWGSACWYFIFPMSGYFLTQLLKDKDKIKRYFLNFGIISLISLIVSIILCSLDIEIHNGKNLENLREHAIYSISCFIFIVVYCLQDEIKNIKIINFLSRATFGVFIIETHTSYSQIICNFLELHLNNYMGLYLISIISILIEFTLYTGIISLLRLIPFIRKIV